MRGHLIVFEGLDGAGKTTQIELLSNYLQQKGYPVIITSWNSSRLVSKAIKRAKKAQLLTPYLYSALHAADFMYRLEKIILPSLHEGYIVIADRYAYTGLARDIARNVDRRWVENIYALAPKPDLAFYCKAPVEESLERIMERNGGSHPKYYEAGMDIIGDHDPQHAFLQFQARVAAEYEQICNQYGLIEIDTTQSIEDVHAYVSMVVDEHLSIWNERDESHYLPKDFLLPSEQVLSEIVPLDVRLISNFYSTLSPHGFPGKFIVIEGMDTSATALQANLLYNELTACGYDVRIALTEKSWVGTEVSRRVQRKAFISPSTRILLTASEIALYYEQVVVPALKNGAIVVMNSYLMNLCSRYAESGMQPEWFLQIFKSFNIKPDATIFLDTSTDVLLHTKHRSGNGHDQAVMQNSQLTTGRKSIKKKLDESLVTLYQSVANELGWHKIPEGTSMEDSHGEILDMIEKTILSNAKEWTSNESLRESLSVFSRYGEEYEHARYVARIAVSLFHQTVYLHACSNRESQLLYYAALLHDIGHTLSGKRHEQFTYETIMQHKFTTLTAVEKEMIANIAYLHNQSYSKLKLDHLAHLSTVNQTIVKRLACLLRIADALDESGKQVVQDVRCYEENGIVIIDIHAVSKALPERAAVLRKADMFEKVYQKPLIVVRNGLEKRARKLRKLQVDNVLQDNI